MAMQASVVFVTGASRSGTTLMCRVLGAHSRIAGLKELHFFGDLVQCADAGRERPRDDLVRHAATLLARQNRDLWGGQPNRAERDEAAAIVDALPSGHGTALDLFTAVAGALAAESGKAIPCEQTPRNIFYAGQLLEQYPEARVVHMVRDPRAVLASQKNRWRMRRLGARNVPLGETVRTWINYHPFTMCRLWNAADDAAMALADHPRMMTVRFERLTDDPEGTLTDVCRFLGVEYEPGMTQVPLWGSSNVSHSNDSKGIAKSVSEQWAEVLTEGEIAICERLTGPAMDRLGYRRRSQSPRGRTAGWFAAASYPLHLAGVVLVNPYRAWIQAKATLSGRLRLIQAR